MHIAASEAGRGGSQGVRSGSLLSGGFQRSVHSRDDAVGGEGRASHSVDVLALHEGAGLADELVHEAVRQNQVAYRGNLIAHVDGQGGNRAVLVLRDGHMHIAASEAGGRSGDRTSGSGIGGSFHSGLLGIVAAQIEGHGVGILRRSAGRVDRLDDRLGGHGGTGQGVDAAADGEGRALADELLSEGGLLGGTGAEAGGLVGRVDVQAGHHTRVIHRQLDAHLGLEALRAALMDAADQLHLLHDGRSRGTLGDHIAGRNATHLIDAVDGRVGGAQHRIGGDGRAGDGLDGATVGSIDQLELLPAVGLFLPAHAEAGGLGEAGVADDGALHHAIVADAQRDGHGARITGRRRHDRVAHGRAGPVHRLKQAGDAGIALGDGQLIIGAGRQHSLERRIARRRCLSGDGALGHFVGHGQHKGRHQRDDRQHQKCRKLLLGRFVGHLDCLLVVGNTLW